MHQLKRFLDPVGWAILVIAMAGCEVKTTYESASSAKVSVPEAASGASNSVTPVAAATVPGAPIIGTATASAGQATISFSPPPSNGGSVITSYTVTSSPGSLSATGAASPLTVTGLTNGTAYTFTVKARNAVGVGTTSAVSNAVTPAAAATVPSAPLIGTASAGNGQATVSFSPPTTNGGAAISSYRVISSPGNLTATGTASPITVTGLTNGTAYTFRVSATNSVGTGVVSGASNSVTPATVPGAPLIGTASAGNGQAIVAFTAPTSNGGAAISTYRVTSNPGTLTATGATSPITVSGLANGTAYTFTVTATNSVGTGAPSSASNSVKPASPPVITTPPSSQAVVPGTSVTFMVAASGTPPFTYAWKQNGVGLPGKTEQTLVINPVATTHAGAYTAVVTNSAGSVTSAPATLTVSLVAPTITAQPQPKTAAPGETAVFRVTVAGSAPYTYVWTVGTSTYSGTSSNSNSEISVPVGAAARNGQVPISVTVSNAAGSVRSNTVNLTISGGATPPAITTQPLTQTVNAGEAFSLSVVATSFGTLTYQWYMNGSAIPGATSSTLTYPRASQYQQGKYHVQISDSAGQTVSNVATVTVIGKMHFCRQYNPFLDIFNIGSVISTTCPGQKLPQQGVYRIYIIGLSATWGTTCRMTFANNDGTNQQYTVDIREDNEAGCWSPGKVMPDPNFSDKCGPSGGDHLYFIPGYYSIDRVACR